MQSLDLLLDPEADAAVRTLWRRIAEAGLPSQADHRGASNAPHVTLLTRPSIPLDPPRSPRGAAAGALPLPIVLGAPLVLGQGARRAVALLVIPSRELLQLHAEIVGGTGPDGLGVGGAGSDDSDPDGAGDLDHGRPSLEAPGRWTPHVTLARGVPRDAIAQVLAAIDPLAEIAAVATTLRHWDSATRTVTSL